MERREQKTKNRLGSFRKIAKAFCLFSFAAFFLLLSLPLEAKKNIAAQAKQPVKVSLPNPLVCEERNNYLEEKYSQGWTKTQALFKNLDFRCNDCSCASTMNGNNWGTLQRLQKSTVTIPSIPPECILESMSKGADLASRFINCPLASNAAPPTFSPQTPCVSKNSLQFVHGWVNASLSCMNGAFRPLNAEDVKEIFAIINHESRFQTAVDSRNGRCLMQLTDIAPTAFYQKDYPIIRRYWEAVKARPECAPFKPYVDNGLQTREIASIENPNEKITIVPSCQFTSAAEPPAKCLIIGLSLYLAYYDMADEFVQTAAANGLIEAKDKKQITRLLTRGFYNRGPDPSKKTWRFLLLELNKKRRKDPELKLSPADFTKQFERSVVKFDGSARHFKYLTKVDRDYDLLTKSINRTCP